MSYRGRCARRKELSQRRLARTRVDMVAVNAILKEYFPQKDMYDIWYGGMSPFFTKKLDPHRDSGWRLR